MAVLSFHAFEIGAHNVVILAGGYALGKFSVMVRIKIPLGFLVGSDGGYELSRRKRDGHPVPRRYQK